MFLPCFSLWVTGSPRSGDLPAMRRRPSLLPSRTGRLTTRARLSVSPFALPFRPPRVGRRSGILRSRLDRALSFGFLNLGRRSRSDGSDLPVPLRLNVLILAVDLIRRLSVVHTASAVQFCTEAPSFSLFATRSPTSLSPLSRPCSFCGLAPRGYS